MKHSIKAIPIIYAAAFCAAVLAGPSAKANSMSINGSIGFGSGGVVVNNSDLASATAVVSVTSPTTDGDEEFGTYAGVPNNTPVVFSGFMFSPAQQSVMPLWTFDVGPASDPTVYSFDATSMSSSYDPTLQGWIIGGNGMAMVSGYAPTEGTWRVTLLEGDSSFVFSSVSTAEPFVPGTVVPDGGSGAVLLGGACFGLGVFGRKFRR
jgi:hypothetical protein